MVTRFEITPDLIAKASRRITDRGNVPHFLALKSALVGYGVGHALHPPRLVRSLAAAIASGAISAAVEGRVLVFRAADTGATP